jgi:hypothetical protein
MPAIRFPLEGDCLGCILDRLVQFDLNIPDVLEIDPVALELATVTVGWKPSGVEAVAPLESGKPGFSPALTRRKKNAWNTLSR